MCSVDAFVTHHDLITVMGMLLTFAVAFVLAVKRP